MKNKNRNNKIFSFLFLGLLLSAVGVSAFGMNKGFMNEEVFEAIENDDYESWKTIMQSSITETNFQAMQENHQQIRRRDDPVFQDLREITREAINNNDYDAYILAINEYEATYEGNEITNIMTEDDFATLVEIHSQRESSNEFTNSTCENGNIRGSGRFEKTNNGYGSMKFMR